MHRKDSRCEVQASSKVQGQTQRWNGCSSPGGAWRERAEDLLYGNGRQIDRWTGQAPNPGDSVIAHWMHQMGVDK